MKTFYVPTPNAADADKPDALWRMAGDLSSAVPLALGAGYDWIGLEPSLSSPHAVVGIVLPHTGRAVALTPGRVLPFDRRADQVLCFNAMKAALGYSDATVPAGNYGRAVIVAGTADELPAYAAGLEQRSDPSPKVGVIAASGTLALNAVLKFPTTNLRGLRITCVGTDVNGAFVVAGDLAITLQLRVSGIGTNVLGQPMPTGLDGDPLGPAVVTDLAAQLLNLTNVNNNLIVDSTHMIFDVPIVVPSIRAQVFVAALAGTGIVNAGVVVEGAR